MVASNIVGIPTAKISETGLLDLKAGTQAAGLDLEARTPSCAGFGWNGVAPLLKRERKSIITPLFLHGEDQEFRTQRERERVNGVNFFCKNL
jgi:hypothetical protein